MAGVRFPCSWRNYRPTCCQEPWLGEASAAPSRRAGGGADGNSITPGSADCLIYFKIKQMAAAGVCLSSAQSRAHGQEPQGSCAKNFSMTLVVKPPLPLPFELQPHHTHGLLAPSPRARRSCARLSASPFVSLAHCLNLSLSFSFSLCLSLSVHVSVSVSISLSLLLFFTFHHSVPQETFLSVLSAPWLPPAPSCPAPTRLSPHSSPPLPSPWPSEAHGRTAKSLWPLSVLWAVPSLRHHGWENQAQTVKS